MTIEERKRRKRIIQGYNRPLIYQITNYILLDTPMIWYETDLSISMDSLDNKARQNCFPTILEFLIFIVCTSQYAQLRVARGWGCYIQCFEIILYSMQYVAYTPLIVWERMDWKVSLCLFFYGIVVGIANYLKKSWADSDETFSFRGKIW